ncbi:MAG TPA: class I SAM-dependent methyltransferase [Vicinamibacterales bacterium]
MKSITSDPTLAAVLERLHDRSEAQSAGLSEYFGRRIAERSLTGFSLDADALRFLSDKLVALERPKAEFCFNVCRALRARRVVEAGTSFGVSTLYLAAAVRANSAEDGGAGLVIGTEHEPRKAAAARQHFAEAGLTDFIELREGDLPGTLADLSGPIDFMLIDIWTAVALPALKQVAPHLRPGAVIVCDNTTLYREAYRDYFNYVTESNGFSTMTLPFDGGLEFTVKI